MKKFTSFSLRKKRQLLFQETGSVNEYMVVAMFNQQLKQVHTDSKAFNIIIETNMKKATFKTFIRLIYGLMVFLIKKLIVIYNKK